MIARYRMQSLRTGWGIEAEKTPEGRKALEKIRKEQKTKFKFARIYNMLQAHPDKIRLLEPFMLTDHMYV